MTPLDGFVLLLYMLGVAIAVSGAASLFLAAATRSCGRWSWPRFHHFAQGLTSLAGCGVFLGLSSLTVTMLRRRASPPRWSSPARALLLAGAGIWSLWLGWRIARPRPTPGSAGLWRLCLSLAPRR